MAAIFLTRKALVLQASPFPPEVPPRQPRPPWKQTGGEYCIRAACEIVPLHKLHPSTHPLDKIVGYDRYMGIVADVENACAAAASQVDAQCTAAVVTMLSERRKACAGEIYFLDGSGVSKRLL
jgi:hypothetical protein